MNAKRSAARAEQYDENQPGDAAAPQTAPTDQTAADPVEQHRADLKECQDRYLRAQAESQNIARRLTEEKLTALRYAESEFAKALLPVADNFERLMAELTPERRSDPFMQGVKLVYEMLKKTLADHQVTPIDSLHQPFDPKVHDAIRHEETRQHPPGVVMAEYQKGYRIANRVLRPAKVAISAAPGTAESSENHGS